MIIAFFLWAQILAATASTSTQTALEWTEAEPARLVDVDDDIRRNAQQGHFFDNIEIREVRFSENGFDWHLFRFESADGKTGPLWLVPHDDENAAFDAMIAALKEHGGVGIAVNSGPDSMRMQTGSGICGVRHGIRSSCDIYISMIYQCHIAQINPIL